MFIQYIPALWGIEESERHITISEEYTGINRK